MAVVKKDFKYGIIDKNNNVLLPFIYDGCGHINDLIHIRINKKSGVLDEKFKVIIPLDFDDVSVKTGFDNNRFIEAKKGDECLRFNLLGEIIGNCDK
jgi:hypothetical protein